MMNTWHIGEILIQKKLISWAQLDEALKEQKRTREFVGEILIRKRYIPQFLLFKALAERHALPFVDLSNVYIDPGAIERIPQSIAKKYGMIPIELQGNMLVAGVCDPTKVIPEKEIAALANVSEIKIVLCTPETTHVLIEKYYNSQKAGV